MKKFEAPQIWVPKLKILEAELGFLGGSVGDGEYTFTRRKADTLEVRQEVGPCKNLITNYGLNIVGTTGFANACYVGTGNTPPANTDTTLVAVRNYTNTVQTAGTVIARGGAPDYWAQYAITYRFAAGTASGNLTEVGVGRNVTTTPLVYNLSSRALIVDGAGNPITITVLDDEVLDVTYSLRFYPYLGADVVQNVILSGITYTFTTRSAFLNNAACTITNAQTVGGSATVYTGTAEGTPPALGLVTAGLSNSGGSAGLTTSALSYVDGSLTIGCTLTAALNTANLTYGIRGMLFNTYASTAATSFLGQQFQSVINPRIPKTASNVLSFGGSISWNRKT